MKKNNLFIPLIAAALLTTGCVSKKQYAELQSDYETLKNNHTDLQNDYQNAQVELASYRTKGSSLEERLADERRRNEELRRDYAELQKSLDKSLRQSNQGSVNISKLVDEINASNR